LALSSFFWVAAMLVRNPYLCLCEALALPLNFAKLCFAQVIVHNPLEINALANYAQAPTFAPTFFS